MYDASRVINGTWGKLSINGEDVAEVTGLEAATTVEKEEVKQVGTLLKQYKVVGAEGKGTVKVTKVYSRFHELMHENIRNGKSTVCTIVSELADPESGGERESVQLNNCMFDKLIYASWEAGKLGDESYDFTYSDAEILSSIPTPTA